MRTIYRISILLVFVFFATDGLNAQILKRIKERVAETAENKVVNKAGEATEKSMENVEEDIKGKGKSKPDKKSGEQNNTEDDVDEKVANSEKAISGKNETSTIAAYSNYDFVPGDKLIYFYDMVGEKDAEIPGRMRIDEGNAEIQTYKDEKVLFIPAGGRTYMNPSIKEKSYLPEQFTVEFDMLSNGGLGTTIDNSQIDLYFREKDETMGAYGSATASIRMSLAAVSGDKANYGLSLSGEDGESKGTHQNFPKEAINSKQENWRRVAIYVNKNIAKLYIDQHRLGVLNQVVPGKAATVDIEINTPEHPVLIRNFRIAAGGADAYNKVVTDGKFIAYGIQFDVNKAILKPESMGTINEIAKMLKEHNDLRFEIGGHTDSDGTADLNNKLSQSRAEAVKTQLTTMGIDASRLTVKGYGSSKPIAENNSNENKARNRRVEFVKQ